MRLLQLTCSASLLLGLPLASAAQAAAPVPRFYGGVGLYSSWYNTLGSHYGDGNTVPVQVTLGYQLRPRLAVQGSFAYSSYSGTNAGTVIDYYTGLGNSYLSNYRNRFYTLAAQVRYTLTRQPSHHFQFDILGGFTRESYSYDGNGYYPSYVAANQPTVTSTYDNHSSNSNYLINAGPSVRYRIGQRFELAYSWTLGLDLRAAEHPHDASSLGIRYRFGR
jgi:hypothetical protein